LLLLLPAFASFGAPGLISEIGDLKSLKTLRMPCNAIRTMPPEIGALVNLRMLDLNSNKLLTGLPPSLVALPKLAALMLHNTSIATLPGMQHNSGTRFYALVI
jgi:Leucine-rich repeat (LRR) protein